MTYVMYKLFKHQKKVNGEWVDVSIIDGECGKMPQDYDDTKQEYLGCH